MLDFAVHQASGLQGMLTPPGSQLVAMVCHGDERIAMPLLWKLCSAYLDLGYALTVLDATRAESRTAPGLAQLLEGGYWPGGQNHPEAAWQVLPAANGLTELAARGSVTAEAWQQLGLLFAEDAVVLVYGKPETIAALLRGTGVKPLLAVSSSKNALLTSYLALKRLLMDGRLEPTIVNTGEGSADVENPMQAQAAANLMECARTFLGYETRVLDLSPQTIRGGKRQDYDLRALASRLLESGLPLTGRFPRVQTASLQKTQAFAESH
jgi:hypothetical protein